MGSGSCEETDMYPNPALSAGQLAIIAVVAVLSLAIWLTGVYVAAREPRDRGSGAEIPSLPRHPADVEDQERKAALFRAADRLRRPERDAQRL
jgi:hypothetical protein